ncbi:MAG TPA: RagB/SusD family nutrient uptake outer membrane protein [Gemmatimonadaceae bacterium]
MTNKSRFALFFAAAAMLAGCNLDKTNPNAPSQGTILTSRDGIVALAVGLQARYATGMAYFIYPGGLISDELGTPIAALQSYKDAEVGALADTYGAVEDPWTTHYQTIKSANDLIANAGNVNLGGETLSGILSISYLLKGASLGELLQQYQQIIVNPSTLQFVDRPTALAAVLALLDSALAENSKFATRPEFDASIKAAGFNVKNTILAMQARYQRLGNNWAAALVAANAVDTSVVSFMNFSDQAINPVFDLSSRSSYIRPRDTVRVIAEPGDARIAFNITGPTVAGTVRPIRSFAQYPATTSPIAFYWPGEIMLIKAEALANTNQLALAAQMVNYVRTRCGGAANQPKACLPALPASELTTKEQIIAEIYKQRKFELFGTGLRWEDVRRLGLVSATSPYAKRCWLLYPNSERNTQPNVPANPNDPPANFSTCL